MCSASSPCSVWGWASQSARGLPEEMRVRAGLFSGPLFLATRAYLAVLPTKQLAGSANERAFGEGTLRQRQRGLAWPDPRPWPRCCSRLGRRPSSSLACGQFRKAEAARGSSRLSQPPVRRQPVTRTRNRTHSLRGDLLPSELLVRGAQGCIVSFPPFRWPSLDPLVPLFIRG